MAENGNGNGPKIPTWMLMAALLGGPALGAGGGKALSTFHDHPDVFEQCQQKFKYLQWRLETLEMRLPKDHREWTPY